MKLIICLLFTVVCFSQTTTESYNRNLKRYEYRDAYGTLTGIKTYDYYNRVWVYTPVTQNTTNRYPKLDYGHAIDASAVELQGQVAMVKQQRYDNNRQRIQNEINNLRGGFTTEILSCPQYKITRIRARFDKEYVEQLNKGNYDVSSNSTTEQLIKWLNDGAMKIIIDEI